uniref:Uncharacterized protein n=1 Tax=Oryza punctata TaxID=4537 RepID=A0A0E0KAB1_ORYPU
MGLAHQAHHHSLHLRFSTGLNPSNVALRVSPSYRRLLLRSPSPPPTRAPAASKRSGAPV